MLHAQQRAAGIPSPLWCHDRLTDGLITSNGIISSKLAGELRYMDSMCVAPCAFRPLCPREPARCSLACLRRPEEQRRGITMKASSITLVHKDVPYRELRQAGEAGVPKAVPYLINLVDSPGHVDFSADVSTAVRVCDGAVLVVDVVEGVCVQTHAVLAQAWEDGVMPCLVLNKVDRLITELGMTPADAYSRMQRVLEHVNVAASSLLSARQIEVADAAEAEGSGSGLAAFGTDAAAREERRLFFSPTKGNVVFASAGAGWAFSLDDFAGLLSEKLGVPRGDLRRHLWGPHALKKGTSTFLPAGPDSKRSPMFVEYVLTSIWRVYAAAQLRPSVKRMQKVVAAFNLDVPDEALEHPEGATRVKSLMRAWLPLSKAVLSMVARCLPSPAEAQAKRLDILLGRGVASGALPLPGAPPEAQARREAVIKAIAECDSSDDAPVVVFITKLVAQPAPSGVELARAPSDQEEESSHLTPAQVQDVAAALGLPSSQEDAEVPVEEALACMDEGMTDSFQTLQAAHAACTERFYAFGRVFAGTIRPGQRLFLISPPGTGQARPGLPLCLNDVVAVHVQSHVQPGLMMGRDVHPLPGVPAGNVVCLSGLSSSLMKQATLSTSPLCPSFASMPTQSTPLLKVTVSAKSVGDMPALQRGLQLLNQADPCASIGVSADGELQLAAVGELHLANCVEDLVKRFAQVEVEVSPPVLAFRETITLATTSSTLRGVGAALVRRAAALRSAATPSDPSADGDEEEEAAGPAAGGDKATGASLPEAPPSLLAALPCPGASVAGVSASVASTEVRWDAEVGCLCATSTIGVDGGASADGPRPSVTLHVALSPVPEKVAQGVQEHASVLVASSRSGRRGKAAAPDTAAEHAAKVQAAAALELMATDEDVLAADTAWPARLQSLLGVDAAGSCLLSATAVPQLTPLLAGEVPAAGDSSGARPGELALRDPRIRAALLQGFELACRSGPITAEPLFRVCADIAGADIDIPPAGAVPMGSVALAATAAMRAVLHYGVALHGARLVEPVYRTELQCSGGRSGGGEQLGNLYAILSKRRGEVDHQDVISGTTTFLIVARLPVHESLGFAQDLRDATSGAASAPQMQFSHWQVIDSDPFSLRGAGEETPEGTSVAELSATASHMRNTARRYMDASRTRKGLQTQDKVVVHAEKQRTLARKK